MYKLIIVLVFVLFAKGQKVFDEDTGTSIYLPNLSTHCMRCLCNVATECNLTRGCDKGYCGPYKISRIYWKDAKEVTLPDDDKERAGAYEDCALSYYCAQKIVLNYFVKYARDCNGDGVTDCEDYMMINFNGGYQCHPPLDKSPEGRNWVARYKSCGLKNFL